MKTLLEQLIEARDENKLSKKLLKDLETVLPIIEKAPYGVNNVEAFTLLNIYSVAYHDDGKIEDITSCDSSCNGCTFCAAMRAAAAKDPEIICGKCYDAAQETRWKNVKYRHMLNLLIMSSVLFTEEELSILPANYITRINSSGDIENLIHARNMIRYAKAHLHANVGFWSKNFPVMTKAFDIEGKPKNVCYVASSPRLNTPIARPKYADYVFTVYSDKSKLQAALAVGAVECNGKKCKNCGFMCYLKKWPIGSNIAELLRL